jgi:NhaP-type Na+/H+ or K+/H+ antiporter
MTNDILAGLGLVIVLAIASQLAASRLRIPAIVLLLPVGFVAGAITNDVHPDVIFGNAFQPLVSLGVGVILFEAGLRLHFDELPGAARGSVLRLISLGTLMTAVGVSLSVELLFGLGWGVSAVLGALLVVSGPTVVSPLLSFVRPSFGVRSLLNWEGTLIDPLGALLGVVVFQAVSAGAVNGRVYHPGEMLLSLGVGFAAGVAAAALLAMILRSIQRSTPGQGIAAALMVLAGVIVAADLLREDSGLFAAVVMGMALARQRRLDVARILEFQGTVVNLLIGMLFVLISASVTPAQVRAILPEGIGLIALMVFVIRPLVVATATRGSELSRNERAFTAWMAPRGIVAGATASSFGLSLTQAGVSGANQILPIAFLVIFGTVALYGLSAAPVARLLGVAGAGAPVIVLVGAHSWARAIGHALKAADVRVRLWTGNADERAAARDLGLDARKTPLGVDVQSREAELEDVDSVLLLTESDDFNALAAYELRQELGNDRVYRLAFRRAELRPVPADAEGRILFGRDLTFTELTRRFESGAEVIEATGRGSDPLASADRLTPMFVITRDGRLRVVSAGAPLEVDLDDRMICLVDGALELAAAEPTRSQAER